MQLVRRYRNSITSFQLTTVLRTKYQSNSGCRVILWVQGSIITLPMVSKPCKTYRRLSVFPHPTNPVTLESSQSRMPDADAYVLRLLVAKDDTSDRPPQFSSALIPHTCVCPFPCKVTKLGLSSKTTTICGSVKMRMMGSNRWRTLLVFISCLIAVVFGQTTTCSATDFCLTGCCGNGGIEGNE